jgi:hypothetical protein
LWGGRGEVEQVRGVGEEVNVEEVEGRTEGEVDEVGVKVEPVEVPFERASSEEDVGLGRFL